MRNSLNVRETVSGHMVRVESWVVNAILTAATVLKLCSLRGLEQVFY